MMRIQKTEDGTLLVPTRLEEGGMIGDTMREIHPGDKEYSQWLAEYEREQGLS